MKLLRFFQTPFLTKDNLNKVIVVFDEVIKGTAVELLGCKTSVIKENISLLIPAVSEPLVCSLNIIYPNGDIFPNNVTISPVKKCSVNIVNITNRSKMREALETIKDFPNLKLSSVEPVSRIINLPENIEANLISTDTDTRFLSTMQLLSVIKEKKNKGRYIILDNFCQLSEKAVSLFCQAGIEYVVSLSKQKDLPRLFKISGDNIHSLFALNIDRSDFFTSPKLDFTYPDSLSPKDRYFGLRIGFAKGDFGDVEDYILNQIKSGYDLSSIPIFANISPEASLALCDFLKSRWENPHFRLSTISEFSDSAKLSMEKNIITVLPDFNGHFGVAISEKKQRYYQNVLDMITVKKSDKIITVFNPHLNCECVRLSLNFPVKDVMCQKIGDKYITEKVKISSGGVRSFIIGNSENNNTSTTETPFYKISYCKITGRIYSIIHKSSLRELVNDEKYSLFDTVDENIVPQKLTAIQNGSVALVFNTEDKFYKKQIVFFKDSEDIELSFKHVSKESAFLCFPLKIREGKFFKDDSDKPLLKAECIIQDKISVKNDEYETALTIDLPALFHLGIIYQSTPSDFYNHRNTNLFLQGDSENTVTMNPNGDIQCKTLKNVPFIFGYSCEKKIIATDSKNLRLLSVLKEDNSFFIQLENKLTKPANETVVFPFEIKTAYYTDFSGKTIFHTYHTKNTVKLDIPPLSITTLRIVPVKKT